MDENVARWRRWLRPDVVLVVLAVAAGASGTVLASRYLAQRAAATEAQVAQRYAGQEVVVASVDVARGMPLSADNMAVRSIPRDFVPPDAVPAARAGELLGATTAVDVARGTPIVPAVLAEQHAAARLSAVLSVHERALTLAVDELDSQAGGLRAGDRVDLYYTQRSGGGVQLVPLLQQVEILGVGDSFLAQDGTYPRSFATVTLRVNTVDAPRLLLAQQAGDLSVLLRSRDDAEMQPQVVRNSSELLRQPVVRRDGAQIELLIGGAGEQVPQRRMITAGAARRGEAS